MKRNSIQFLIGLMLLLCGGAVYADLVAPAIRISGDNGGIELSTVAISSGASAAFKSWGPEEKRKQSFDVYLRMKSNEWSNGWVSFKAAKDGMLSISLLGSYKLVNGKKQRINVLFDDITVEGSTLKNGNFESVKGKIPAEWNSSSQDENGPRYLSGRGVNGSACVMTWHDGGFSQSIPCVKDAVITIRLSYKLADANDEAVPVATNSAEPVKRTARPNNLPDTFVNIASAANMGFADDKAGDGKGGWSDQGSQSDFSGFDTNRTDYRGVSFSILDPQKNDGKAVLTFKSDNISSAVKLDQVTFQTGGAKAQYLYLLHTACFAHKTGEPVGTVTIKTKSGRTIEHKLTIGRDLADWWDPGHMPNGLVAYRKQNKAANVGLYLSKYTVGEEAEEIESVTLATAGKAIWIVVGVTLSGKDIDLTPPKFVLANQPGWKTIDISNTVVAEKSALDFSALVEAGPAGKHGRVIVGTDGNFAFADAPDKPVRFFGFVVCINHPFSWPEFALKGKDETETRANLKRYAQSIRRQGYNLVRMQVLDAFLVQNAKEDRDCNEVNVDRLCYFIAALKEEGVYSHLELFGWGGYLKGAWDAAGSYKRRFMVEEDSRIIWEKAVNKLMAIRNPYTGTTFANENAIAIVDCYNEQELGFYSDRLTDPKVKQQATTLWQEFLQKRYGSVAAVEKAWGKKLPAGTTFATIPIYDKNKYWERSAVGNDLGLFIYERERNMIRWYEKSLRAAGYPGLWLQFDVDKSFAMNAARNETPVVSMHTYHTHASSGIGDSTSAGVKVGQFGAVSTAGNYFHAQIGSRFLNRPFGVFEYGTYYWTRYRHEEGLLYPAYSSLQNISALTVTGSPVIFHAVKLRGLDQGSDPVSRASQVLAALIYGRRDVAPSTHTVALAFNDDYLSVNANMNRAVNTEQSKIALLCRFGLQYAGPVPAGLPPYPKADLTVAPIDGAKIVSSQWASSVLDSATGNNLDGVIGSMKAQGLLSSDNLSNPARGIYQSDTKEITMNVREEKLTVIAPRMEGVILKDNKSAELDAIKSVSTTVAAAIGVASLDGATVAQSKKLLIVYSTDALNSGFEATDDRVTLVNSGKMPILMQTGVLKLALRTSNGAGMTLWALGYDGVRREKIPFAPATSGEAQLTIDTSTLKNGPTPFFELVAE